MNMGLVTSYIIAGMLMLSILAMNLNLSSSSAELSMSAMKKIHLNSIVEVLSNDIPKIGYNRKTTIDSAKVIQKADSAELWFYSNIDNSTDETVETVKWQYTSTGVSGTENPNDYILKRTVLHKGSVNSKVDIPLGVTNIEFRYYNELGSKTPMATPVANSDLDQIKQIEVEVTVQSSVKSKPNPLSAGDYITSKWKKRFTPVNLNNN